MKKRQDVIFLGDSLIQLGAFPDLPKQRLGYQLDLIQQGETPLNWSPVPGLGKGVRGVRELRERIKDGWYRVIYVANIGDAVYVLHAFIKKSNQIERNDILIIKQRFKEIPRGEN